MKKVILQEKRNEVYLDDLKDEDFIGMQTKGGNKFILSARKHRYEFIGGVNLMYGGKIHYSNFKSAITDKYSLFLFDTAKELFKWMSE